MSILLVLGCLFLIILVLFASLLLFPITYSLAGNWGEKLRGLVRIRTGLLEGQVALGKVEQGRGNRIKIKFAGLSFLDSPMGSGDVAGKGKKQGGEAKNKKKNKKKNKDRAKGSFQDLLILIDRELWNAILNVLGKIFRTFRPKILEVRGSLGFDDPYYTGIFMALRTTLPWIDVEPDFSQEIRDMHFKLEGSVIPAVLLTYVVGFLFSREVRPLLRHFRDKKRALKINKQNKINNCNPVNNRSV